jgi:hypothetical protein
MTYSDKQEMPTSNFLNDFLSALQTGWQHTMGQVSDDLSSLMSGQVTGDMINRMLDVAQELPLGRAIGKVGKGLAAAPDVAKGIFGPIRTKQQKQVAKSLWRADPDTFRAVAADPRQMDIRVPEAIPMTVPAAQRSEMVLNDPISRIYGLYRNKGNMGFGGRLEVNPRVLRGMSPDMRRKPVVDIESNLPSTTLHEATHFLNVPEVYSMSDDKAKQLAMELMPYLHEQGMSSVANRLDKNLPTLALDEALAYLSEAGMRKLTPEAKDIWSALKVRAKPGLAKGQYGVAREAKLPKSHVMTTLMTEELSKNPLAQGLIEELLAEFGGKPARSETTSAGRFWNR